jgi:hypothetical protein
MAIAIRALQFNGDLVRGPEHAADLYTVDTVRVEFTADVEQQAFFAWANFQDA